MAKTVEEMLREKDWQESNAKLLHDIVFGAGETGASLVSGMVAQPLSGLAGLGSYAKHKTRELITGKDQDAYQKALRAIEGTQRDFSYEPKTESGKRGLENVGAGIKAIVDPVAERTVDPIGEWSPVAGAGIKALASVVDPTKLGRAKRALKPIDVEIGSKLGPKSVATAFDDIIDPAEAAKFAQEGGHLKPRDKGGYVGAPEKIKSEADLEAQRGSALAKVKAGDWNADWYIRQRQLAEELAPSRPDMQSLFARGTAAYSPQAQPVTELGSFIRQHNAKVLSGEDVRTRTGAQLRNVSQAYDIDPSTGAITFMPERITQGKKTGPYADAKNPTVPAGSLYKTANDIWHGRVMGYGDDFSRGFTPQEHGYLTGENLVLADRANQAGIPVGSQPPGTLHDPRSMQAATWGSQRYAAYEAKEALKAAKDAAAGRTPQPRSTPEELRARASGGLDTAMPLYRYYLTNEAVPGAGTGHLKGMVDAPEPVRQKYTDDIRAATGRDPSIEAWSMFQEAPRTTVGEYKNTLGNVERQPGWTDPVTASVTGKPVKGTGGDYTPKIETEAMSLAAKIGAVLRGQEAGAGSRVITKKGISQENQNAVVLPASEVARKTAKEAGYDVIDQGDQLVVTHFPDYKKPRHGAGTIQDELRNTFGQDYTGQGRLEGVPGRMESVYEHGLAKEVGRGAKRRPVPTAEGSGEATTALLDRLEKSGINEVHQRLDAGRWKTVADAYNKIDEAAAATHSMPLRQDLMKLRKIISESGFSGLRDYVAKNGAAGLPVLGSPGFDFGGQIRSAGLKALELELQRQRQSEQQRERRRASPGT
jgi:hypothetical protein